MESEFSPPTMGEVAEASSNVEVRRRLSAFHQTDVVAVVGAVAASVSLTAIIFTQIAPFSGLLGFLAVSYPLFICLYALLISLNEGGPTIRDRIASIFVHSLAVTLVAALVFVVSYTLWRGYSAFTHLNFFTDDMSQAGPLDPLTAGGALHAVVGTLQQITIALAVTIPLGVVCAAFLNETRGGFTRFVRTIVDAMTALPSIVAGLFIYATVILIIGVDKSGFAASLALGVMMLPIIIRAADVVIRLVPGSLREASLALGASQWRTVWHVTLPTARSGLVTAIILGMARGVGETSPVLLTAGFSTRMNTNPFSGPQVSLPLATFSFVRSPQPAMITRGFGTAALLMALVLLLFIIARIAGGRPAGTLSPRQYRRRIRASLRDLQRFDKRDDPTTQKDSSLEEIGLTSDPPRHRVGPMPADTTVEREEM